MAFAQKRAHSDATEDASLDFFPLNFKNIENSVASGNLEK